MSELWSSTLLEQLSKAQSPNEQSAIVANLSFAQLPQHVAMVARHCIILRWFDESIVQSISRKIGKNDTETNSSKTIYQVLTNLRFVDNLGNRAVFHSQTRQGLIESYSKTDPEFLIASAHTAAMIYLTHLDQISAELEALFCYVVAGQEENSLEILDKLLIESSEKNDWHKVLVMFDTLKEAVSLPFVKPIRLTETHYFVRGIAFEQLKEYEHALEDYGRVIELNPQIEGIYMYRGRMHYELLAYREAIEDFSKAIALNKYSETALVERGNVYFELKEYNKAIADFTSAIALNRTNILLAHPWIAYIAQKFKNEIFSHSSIEPFYYRGSVNIELGRWRKAIADFNRILCIDPMHVETYNARGIAYKKQNLLKKAIQDFDMAISLSPNQPRGYINRGDVKKQNGDLLGAVKDFDRVLQLDPDNAKINLERGRIRNTLGDYKDAELDYFRARDIDEVLFDEFRSKGKISIRGNVTLDSLIATQIIPKLNSNFLLTVISSLPYFISLSNRRYYLYESRILIGRTSEQIGLDENEKEFANLKAEKESKTVSRRHAELRQEGDEWYIIHLSETSGSWLNNEQLDTNEPKQLHNGDHLQLGKVQLMFCLPI